MHFIVCLQVCVHMHACVETVHGVKIPSPLCSISSCGLDFLTYFLLTPCVKGKGRRIIKCSEAIKHLSLVYQRLMTSAVGKELCFGKRTLYRG